MLTPRHAKGALAISLAVASAAAQSQFSTHGQVVLAMGDPVAALPGATIDGTTTMDSGSIDLNGNMLFRAPLSGPGISTQTNRALFYGRTNGTIQMVLQSGAAEPSGTLPGVTVNTATGQGLNGSPRLSPEGSYALIGCSLFGPGVITTGGVVGGQNNSCLYWGTPGGTWLMLARYGDFAPSGGAQYQTTFNTISYQTSALNSSGVACFGVTLVGGDVVGTTNNTAWVYGTPGNLQFMIRRGDAVLGGQNTIGTLGFNCAMNNTGQILHDQTLSTTGGTNPATTADDKIVFVFTPGVGHATLVREGDQAVGFPPSSFYGTPSIGQGFSTGGVASFVCTVTGPGVTTGVDDQGLFLGIPGGLLLAARRGDVAPGTGGATFGTINSSSTTAGGKVAFFATVTGAGITTANDSGIWTGTPGNLQLVAREGDPAPGIPGGAVFGSTSGSGGVVAGAVMMNARGQMFFNATTIAGGSELDAYYGFDPIHGLQLLLTDNEMVPTLLGPQAVSTAAGIQFPSSDDAPLSLNANGDYYLRCTFLNPGSALIRGHLGSNVAVPSAIAATTGGTQTMSLNGGLANAGNLYLVAGTVSGTRPGFFVGGNLIPLNFDWWLNLSLSAANTPIYGNTFGVFDPNGLATATFNFPAGQTLFVGTTFHHAFVTINGSNLTLVSEPSTVCIY